LAQWNTDVANGARPAVIFNGTVAESGERLVAATTDLYEQKFDQCQSFAPISTLLPVRNSSQQLRALYEQDLVHDLLVQELGNTPEPIVPVYFRFQGTSTTPLSWHLRPDQLHEIGEQWRGIRNSSDAKKIYEVLHCRGPKQDEQPKNKPGIWFRKMSCVGREDGRLGDHGRDEAARPFFMGKAGWVRSRA
jgi:hypothetical protein